jgi:hypothetical protein
MIFHLLALWSPFFAEIFRFLDDFSHVSQALLEALPLGVVSNAGYRGLGFREACSGLLKVPAAMNELPHRPSGSRERLPGGVFGGGDTLQAGELPVETRESKG